MAAACLPVHCTAPKSSPFSSSSPLRRQTNVSHGSATASRSHVGCVKVAGGECGTKLPAWTNVRQEHWEGDLPVEGHIPAWLNGTYLRNGPGLWDVGEHAFRHLFDGYATLARVSFRRGRATGAHRQIETDAYRAAMARGRPLLREFSELMRRPREAVSLLDRVRDVVGLGSGAALSDNANISVLPLGDGRVLCLTETTKSSVLVDPETLATVGKLRYADRLWGLLQSTHPVVAAASGELLTLMPDFFRAGHRVVRMEAGSSERKVVGRVHCRGGLTPGWVHSFAVTDKYVVVPEMPLRYSVGSAIKSKAAPWYIFDWVPESGSFMHVICKSTGKTVASVEVPNFVALHFINAYEEKGEDGNTADAVIADCCEYFGEPTILDALSLPELRSVVNKDGAPDARVARFRIPLDGSPMGSLETALEPEEHGRGVDMSTINPAYLGNKYRYLYACGVRRPCNYYNTLTKIDLVEKKAKTWHEEGALPSEPLFVARPGATDEDDGVVISIVCTKDGDGYALLLDAPTFEEIARMKLPYGLPCGFHGCWIPGKM